MPHRVARHIGPWVAVSVFLVGLICIATATLIALNYQKRTAEKICRSAVDNRAAVRITWDAARDLVLAGVTDDTRIERTNAFFNAVLMKVPPLRCEGGTPTEVK